MACRKAPRWRRGFLRVLARTGNVRLAASEAGVDHGTAYDHRKRDAGFAARWARTVAKARAKIEASGTAGEGLAKRKDSDPRELVVRVSKNAGTQVVRAGAGKWSPSAEERFFDELLDSANVKKSAAAARFSTTAIYKRRNANPDFLAKWDMAVETGRARLEMMLIQRGTESLDPDAVHVPDGPPRATIDQAIAILRLGEKGMKRAGGWRDDIQEPSIEEVRDEVLRRIAAIRGHKQGADDPSTSPPRQSSGQAG